MLLPQLPALPHPPSWFPGHMMKFTRMLPALLKKTNVVLEIRDSRLPLTSINRTLEGALRKWRLERGWDPNNPGQRIIAAEACEHIVVLNKRDLVPEWGIEPFRKAMEKKFPYQQTLFASWQRPRDIRNLSESLVKIAKRYPHAMELNVLVIGMPNVGKSTLLNALRSMGIKGRTPKVFQTSANPGMTQALSTRLKLSLDPLVYAYDTPGIMLPYLGHGAAGAERGVKLALIAGIKEGLYDTDALASYLLYRLNVLDPISPAYLPLLPHGSSPTNDLEEFLELLARRMGMMKRGGELDMARAAVYFVRWWREDGALLSASQALPELKSLARQITTAQGVPPTDVNFASAIGATEVAGSPEAIVGAGALSGISTSPISQAWGFDLEWEVTPEDMILNDTNTHEMRQVKMKSTPLVVQEKIEACIDKFILQTDREEAEEANISPTQIKKKAVAEEKERRKQKQIAKRLR